MQKNNNRLGRIDEELKKQFDEFCNNVGMTMTTAFCIFAKKTVREQKIPFEISNDAFYSESNIALFSDFSNCEKCDLTAENSLDLFRFESSLNNWLFDDASCVLSHMIAKFKSNFINSQDAKNICAQIYYICCRVLIKKDGSPPEAVYLDRIHHSSDIFTLEQAINQLMAYTKEHFIRTIGGQNRLIENTIKYIHENLSNPLSLENIADHLHISSSHLSRTFKKTCNESLTEFINRT